MARQPAAILSDHFVRSGVELVVVEAPSGGVYWCVPVAAASRPWKYGEERRAR